jgi:hypothetical protein
MVNRAIPVFSSCGGLPQSYETFLRASPPSEAKLAESMEETIESPKKPSGRNLFLARALGLITMLCVFIPAAFWKGGVLDGEAITFIINYADDRTPLQKVFNPQLNDFNTFQARELSFLFDYLDASFYLFLLRHFDIALFIPLSALVSSILIILIYRRGVRRTLPGIDRLTAELSLLPLLTCFVFVSTMGVFYRSAKPLLAPVLLAFMFHILRTAQSRAAESSLEKGWAVLNRQSLVSFGLLFVAALFDRQGFFYVLIAFSVLLVHFLLTRRLKDLLIASGAAAILGHLYNVVLGPAIIWAVNRQPVDFFYQRIPVEELARLPVHSLKGSRLLIANVAAMLGGYYVVGYLFLCIIAGWLVWKAIGLYKERMPGKFRERYASGASLAVIYALMILALQIVMFGLMIARHRFIYDWVDHWYWYYPLPFLMTALFGLALLLNAVLPRLGTPQRRLLRVALVLIAISNLLHLPANRKLMLTSKWFSQEYPFSEMLKASIRHHWPHPDLDGEYTRFFVFHEQKRKSSK